MALDFAERTERAAELIQQGVAPYTAYQIATAEQTGGNIMQDAATGYTQYLPSTPMYSDWTMPSGYSNVGLNPAGGGYLNQSSNSLWGVGHGVDAGQVQCPYGDGYYNPADLPAHYALAHPGQTAPTTGTTTTPTTGTGTTGTGATGTNTTIFAEADPAAYWMNKLGLSAVGGSPVNKWKMNQFAPAYSTWLGGSALGASGGTDYGLGASFADYSGVGDYLGSRQQAANVLRGAGALGSEGQGLFRTGITDTELDQLIKSALSSKYAAPVASRLGEARRDLETQYSAETQGQGDTFLSYLLSKFRL
jgi:hypothetical protein